MKRKLFSMIFAFVALVAFQANAQLPKYFWIDVDTTTNTGATSQTYNGTVGSVSGTGAAVSPGATNYYVDQTWTPNKSSLTFDSKFLVNPFRDSESIGYEKSKYYFKVDTAAIGRKEFRISNYDGTSTLTLNGVNVSNQNRWQVVQIRDLNAGDALSIYSEVMDKNTGYAETPAARPLTTPYVEGYLVYPESGVNVSGVQTDYKMLFVDRKTGEFVLNTYGWWITKNNNGGYVNKNNYNPVWVRFIPIGGRWATPNDFADAEYVRFKDKAGSYLNVDGKQNFRVSYVEAHSPKETGYSTYNYVDITGTKNGGRKELGMYLNPNTNKWEVPVFQLSSPEASCKLVSVKKENVKTVIGGASNGAYADKLELRNAYSGDFYDEEIGTQEWAIWIDEEGNMNVYPRVGYVADYSKASTDPARWLPKRNSDGTAATGTDSDWDSTAAGKGLRSDKYNYGYYQYNVAIYRNYWNIPTSEPLSNESFKIGTYAVNNTTPVLAPVSGYANMTEYSERIFTPETLANYEIATGRFYFLETRPVTAALNGDAKADNNTQSYVVSVFGNTNGKVDVRSQKYSNNGNANTQFNDNIAQYNTSWATTKVVLTPKENMRYGEELDNNQKAYFRNPYDSIRMASHWEVIKVYQAGTNAFVGYKFKNELGYYLQYAAANKGVLAQTPVSVTGDERTSAVWTAVKMDAASEYFQLRNNYVGGPKEVAYTSVFGTAAYLDTIPYSVPDAMYASYPQSHTAWYKTGERVAAVSGNNITKYYWGRDLGLLPGGSCGGGIELKLTSDETNWPKDGGEANVINHTNDARYGEPYYIAQDSLCTYMFRQGVYNITEALGLEKSFEIGTDDMLVLAETGSFGNVSVEPVGEERIPRWVWTNSPTNTVGYWDTKGFIGTDVMWEQNWLESIGADKGGLAASVETPNTTASFATNVGSFYTGSITYGNPSGGIITGYPANYFAAGSPAKTMAWTGVGELLVPDTYKWHYIKYGDMYLVYDTINSTIDDAGQMYGFKFKRVAKQNATPFRFHQPLVGDKRYENYLIEFKVPDFWYEVDYAGNIVQPANSTKPTYQERTHQLNWYGLPLRNTNPYLAQTAIYSGTNADYVNGQTRYAKQGQQTNMVNTTLLARDASRWRFTGEEYVGCQKQFVTSNYMLQNGMYMSPITAEEYSLGVAQDWYISQIANTGSRTLAVEKEGAANVQKLTHVLADTLYSIYDTKASRRGVIGDGVIGSGNSYARYYPDAKGYDARVNVELFYVINEKGQYLTVSDSTDMAQTDPGTTVPDVSGAKLIFRDKYTYSKADADAKKPDLRTLQMFAMYGCMNTDGNQVVDGKAKGYGEFIYLPASSWEMDYTKKYTTGVRKNNVKLGYTNTSGYPIVNQAFRIGLYGKVNNMVVMPASGSTSTSIVAAEYKFTRDEYFKGPFCDHNFVKKLSSGKYYRGQGADVTCADLTDPAMHWEIRNVLDQNKNVIDSTLFFFSTELKQQSGVAYTPDKLKDHYYFIQNKNVPTQFIAIPASAPKDTFHVEITCIDNIDSNPLVCADKYFKFTPDQLAYSDWGIIESYYTDRNVWTDDATFYKYPGTNIGRADAVSKQLKTGESADYLVIQQSTIRKISEHHDIPFYNIIRVKGNDRYYLQLQGDSAVFRTVTASELDSLSKYSTYPDALPQFKFCFPYRPVANACPMVVDTVKYKDNWFKKVFVQSMDVKNTPAYLLKVTATSGRLGGQRIDVNTVDYAAQLGNLAGQLDATTWFFGDNYGADTEWVPLYGVHTDSDSYGVLASMDIKGSYVVPSEMTPNYGILSTDTTNVQLVFEFEGDTLIGKYTPRPIWYYRIKNVKTGEYLTNSLDSAKNTYTWSEGWPYAFFGKLAPNKPGNPITADAKYDQTFGLRYVPTANQSTTDGKNNYEFWVVSRVDYTTPNASEYYYLAQINGRMVFMKADLYDTDAVLKKAMRFQFGQIDNSGKYTGKDDINGGTATIYGVEGAVKVENVEGLVELYSVDGRVISSKQVNGSATITAPRGVVIVKNGANVTKVVVK